METSVPTLVLGDALLDSAVDDALSFRFLVFERNKFGIWWSTVHSWRRAEDGAWSTLSDTSIGLELGRLGNRLKVVSKSCVSSLDFDAG